MSLGDLFEACQFDELVPCLRACYQVEAALFLFKEAFDEFSQMNAELKEIEDIEIPDDKWYSTSVRSYSRRDLTEEDFMILDANKFKKESLDVDRLKEIPVRVDVHHLGFEMALLVPLYVTRDLSILSRGDLAAHCLWELTFYGLPEDQGEMKKRISGEPIITNKYEEAYWKLFNKMRDNEYPKSLRKKDVFPLEGKLKRTNKFKRRRAYRQQKRCDELYRMGQVENAIQRLAPIPRKDLEYLFQTKLIKEQLFRSRTYGKRDRIDYLLELIYKYNNEDYSQDTKVAITIKASSEHPVTEEELSRLKCVENRFNPSVPILWEVGTDDSLEDEVSMLMLASF